MRWHPMIIADRRHPHRGFYLACGLEMLLGLVALALGRLLGESPLATVHLDGRAIVLGGLASLPLMAVFIGVLRWPVGPLVRVRDFLETFARPLFGAWRWWQLAVISALAGLSEELLFRGLIHGGLSGMLGQPLAILVASVAFGLGHAINRAYFVIATVIGACLSGLWLLNGNLLAPIVAHALYDFLALIYFLKVRPISL